MFSNWKNHLKTLPLLADQLVHKVKQEGIIYRICLFHSLPPSLSSMTMFTESEFDYVYRYPG